MPHTLAELLDSKHLATTMLDECEPDHEIAYCAQCRTGWSLADLTTRAVGGGDEAYRWTCPSCDQSVRASIIDHAETCRAFMDAEDEE